MANMRMLIRIVFVIFIANGIDCLGSDNCCDCFKEKEEEIKEEINKNEEIKEDENITLEFLVNNNWYESKENNLVLMIFKKEDDNDIFTSTENGDKISIKLDKDNNPKIEYINGTENKTKLENKKYALFEIKTNTNKTVYLYCSDVESIKYNDRVYGIFAGTTHVSISVIACDTKNVTNMGNMFSGCRKLTKLNLLNFNTTKVTDMNFMFSGCSSLEKLDLKNFNTENVTDMGFMFLNCSSLENLNLNNFNTEKVTNMMCMFLKCSSLKNLDISNFNTTKVTKMQNMFNSCSKLTDLKFGNNFNTKKNTDKRLMFYRCSSFPENIQHKNVEEIINFFKEKNK